jgi:hypothetical protein
VSTSKDVQERVLAEALLHAAEPQLTGEINLGGEELVDTKGSAFAADDTRHLLDQLGVEGAPDADGGVEDGGVQSQESVETLALDEGGNTYKVLVVSGAS